ncbi:MAG: CHAT domain-containing protein [Stigonema ocellatum SAG 48.90 = DSM 106950]|nr:CHAT domain-containing protein [Stigonema ocellatum SAG 48.90 = DSM 106950]
MTNWLREMTKWGYGLFFRLSGDVLRNLGRFEEAIASYDNAIQFKPDYHPALINKGNVLVKLGRNTEAIESYDLALDSIDPQWWEDWNKNQGLANIAEDSKAAVTMSDNGISRLHPQTPKVQESGSESDSKKSERLQDYIMQRLGLFSDLSQAKKSYEEALDFLTFENFPEQHLLVFQELLKVYSRDDAEEFDRKLTQGTQQLEELLSKQESEIEKIRLSSKFAAFNQMRVDILAQSDTIANYIKALEKAEVRKNTCLGWLREGSDYQPHNFNFQQTQKLLNPKTAAIYWHLSPLAITTFIIKHKEPLKVLLPQLPRELQQKNADAHFVQIQRFVTWVQQWKNSYQHYCQGDNTDKETTPWRLNMKTMLQNLRDILEIEQIEHSLQDVDNLILIPHRELHLLPLDDLFATPFIITYVPSFQIGLELLELASSSQNLDSIKLLNVEIPSNNLPFASVQSAVLHYLYPKYGKLVKSPTTKIDLLKALQDCEGYFQFTGHGYHKPEKPRESALVLEKPDELTLGDIFECEKLDLRKYQLICLSACETGITSQETSKERIVDEYVGLVSGFLAKKANYVVSTLWRVDDRSTTILIIKLYQLLKQKETPVAALKQAKNWLSQLTYKDLAKWYKDLAEELNEPQWSNYLRTEAEIIQKHPEKMNSDQCPYAHPYYYAGFIITGKPA